jgi:hypothetical protein
LRKSNRSVARAPGENCLRLVPSSALSCVTTRKVASRSTAERRGRVRESRASVYPFVRRFGGAKFVVGCLDLPRQNLLPNVEPNETFERTVLELVVIHLFCTLSKGECLRRHPVGRQIRPWSIWRFKLGWSALVAGGSYLPRRLHPDSRFKLVRHADSRKFSCWSFAPSECVFSVGLNW